MFPNAILRAVPQLVEHQTGVWRVANLRLTSLRVTMLCSSARHNYPDLVLVQGCAVSFSYMFIKKTLKYLVENYWLDLKITLG